MHICPQEIIALVAMVPVLGLFLARARAWFEQPRKNMRTVFYGKEDSTFRFRSAKPNDPFWGSQ